MRKKENFMITGAIVLARGKKGVIVKMLENNVNGVDHVHFVDVKLEGETHITRYHTDDISEAPTEDKKEPKTKAEPKEKNITKQKATK